MEGVLEDLAKTLFNVSDDEGNVFTNVLRDFGEANAKNIMQHIKETHPSLYDVCKSVEQELISKKPTKAKPDGGEASSKNIMKDNDVRDPSLYDICNAVREELASKKPSQGQSKCVKTPHIQPQSHKPLCQDDDYNEDVKVLTPLMDFQEKETYYVAYFDMPGASRSSISVEIDGTSIIVKANKQPYPIGSDIFHKTERHMGRYLKKFQVLPDMLIGSCNANANYIDGVLAVHIPKLNNTNVKTRVPICFH